jgi:hypothetical protein
VTGDERVYPLPDEDDPRFSFGLVDDVATVLERHGFARPSGWDLLDLRQKLFEFLYCAPEAGP